MDKDKPRFASLAKGQSPLFLWTEFSVLSRHCLVTTARMVTKSPVAQ